MADVVEELASLNTQAKELLERYDGVFSKLDEKTQQALLDIASKSEKGLNDITALLQSGKVAEAENALKLGGKSLEELSSSFSNVKVYDFPFNSSYSTTNNDYDANTLFDVNIPVEAGDVLFLKGFVSGERNTDNDTHILDRFKIDGVVIRDSGTITGNTLYGHASSHCVYVATKAKTVNIKYQFRSGYGYKIDSNMDDGWSGARLTIINFKGANNG